MSHPDLVQSLEAESLAFRKQAAVYMRLCDELAEALRVRGCAADSCPALFDYEMVSTIRTNRQGIFDYVA